MFCRISTKPTYTKDPSTHLLKLYDSNCLPFIIHRWKNNNLTNFWKNIEIRNIINCKDTVNLKIIICWRLFWKISRVLPYPSIQVFKNVPLQGQYDSAFSFAPGPCRTDFFCIFFLHSSYTENDTENTKIQQQEAGGRCNMVSFFSISDQPFP